MALRSLRFKSRGDERLDCAIELIALPREQGTARCQPGFRLGGGFQHPGLGLDVPADFKQMNEFVKHD